jgi:tetratricopeptide (TPR) repeat protein
MRSGAKRLALRFAACGTLCVVIGTPQAVHSQSAGATKKRIPADPAEVALNNLLSTAQTAMDRKDFQTAAQTYQDYLAKKPDDALVHFNLGYAWMAMKKLSDARGEYERAISLDPQMAPAYLNLGLTLIDTDPSAAAAPLQKAVEMMPNQAGPKFLLGTALEENHKFPQAIEQYQAAEGIDGTDFNIRFSLGRALLSAGRPTEAEPELRAAAGMRPNMAPAHLGLARSLIEQKRLDEGAAELAKYLELQPNDVNARLERASALLDMKKYEDALAELDQAVSAGPEGVRALKLRSQIYFEKQRFDDAILVLQKARPLAPNDLLIPALLGHLYLEKKAYGEAVRELTAAYNMAPNSDDVLKDLVLAQYMNKNYPAALDGIDLLSKRESLPPGSWFMRADCYDKLGRSADALEAYQRFLALNKDENNDMYFEASARVRTLARELKKR